MIKPLNIIKALYRANFYKQKPIRPGNYPDGYFMKKSPLTKEAKDIFENNKNLELNSTTVQLFGKIKNVLKK